MQARLQKKRDEFWVTLKVVKMEVLQKVLAVFSVVKSATIFPKEPMAIPNMCSEFFHGYIIATTVTESSRY